MNGRLCWPARSSAFQSGRISELSVLQLKLWWKAVADYRSPRRFARSRARESGRSWSAPALWGFDRRRSETPCGGGVSREDPRQPNCKYSTTRRWALPKLRFLTDRFQTELA